MHSCRPLVNWRLKYVAQIEFQNVSKSFGQTKVIENLNLTIEDGKFTVLVGASGCGKTTLLRMIAGIGEAAMIICKICAQNLKNQTE